MLECLKLGIGYGLTGATTLLTFIVAVTGVLAIVSAIINLFSALGGRRKDE